MFGRFFQREGQGETEADSDARLALGALLVRVARADWDYSAQEVSRIEAILMRRFDLFDAQAADLRVEAEALEHEAADMVQFTRQIKDAVPLEERDKIVEALWELALADGSRDHHEDHAIRQIAPLLGINDRDSGLARQRVEARLG